MSATTHLFTRNLMRAAVAALFATSLALPVNTYAAAVGNLRQIETPANASNVKIATDKGHFLEISLLRPDMFRIWAGSDGKLVGAGDKAAPIVLKRDYSKVDYQLSDQREYQLLQTSKMALRIYKKPLRLALYKADNKTLLWQEMQSLDIAEKSSFQTL